MWAVVGLDDVGTGAQSILRHSTLGGDLDGLRKVSGSSWACGSTQTRGCSDATTSSRALRGLMPMMATDPASSECGSDQLRIVNPTGPVSGDSRRTINPRSVPSRRVPGALPCEINRALMATGSGSSYG